MSGMLEMSRASAVVVAAVIVVSSACTGRINDPPPARGTGPTLRLDAPAPGDSTASVRWSAITRDFISSKPAATKPNPVAALRAFAYLALAQYRAVIAADAPHGRQSHASAQGAAAAASAVVLGSLFPADAAFFESQLSAQEAKVTTSHNVPNAFAAGEVIGRGVGAEVADLARTDRFDAVWTGTAPAGHGYWSSDLDPPRPPQLPLLGQMRPFFMESGDQFRPPPPPAFGSPAFVEALEEVRQISDHRTPDQIRIAEYWALTTGSLGAGFWNEEATRRIARYHLDERRAARALALMHMAAMDASIACYDAKYTYWLIRPYRADPAITTPIPRPNHPSYPSSHACYSGASAYVLGALFPSEATELAALADEAGESRLYAGIHYRFDKDAGLHIARQVAALALQHAPRHAERDAMP
jgi:membrane-associated phospholipid phosphatase